MGETDIARDILRGEIEGGRVPGGIYAVWRGGEEAFCVVEGMADLEAGLPLRRDNIFRVYSMTKPVTAVAAMLLMEEGKLRLTDPVADYLPEYASLRWLAPSGELAPCERRMTLWHLMSMTSGLVYPDPDPCGQYMQRCFDGFYEENLAGRGPTTRQLAALVAEQPLMFEPGTGWRYGLSADVMGAVIEVASDQRFGDFLRERVFEPLGMVDTAFFVPEEKRDRLVQLYKYEDGALAPDVRRHLGLTHGLTPPTFESGGAGLYATLDDYARFGGMLAARGAYKNGRLLSEAAIRLFQAGMVDENTSPDFNWESLAGCAYGCFMRACRDPRRSGVPAAVGEFGWDGWTGTHLSVDADGGNLTLLMTQVGGYDGWGLARRLRRAALDARH